MMDRRDLLRFAVFLVGGSAALSALEACAPRVSDHYLSRARLSLLDEVAEIMIPQTDTPGARAAGVPASFDKMMAQWASPETQAAFDQILDDIDARARDAHSKSFVELEPAQRVAVLTAFDAEMLPQRAMGRMPMPGAGPPRAPGPAPSASAAPQGAPPAPAAAPASPPAYPRFKDLILTTYYLSEPGATQELRHEQVPGPWRGDIPYSEVGRSWAY